MALVLNNITINNSKQNTNLFSNFSLVTKPKQVNIIVAPSGFGKTSLIYYIFGCLDKNNFTGSGQIKLFNKILNNLSSYKRRIGIAFQEVLLFPHMNIYQNLYFALPKKINKEQADFIIKKACENAQIPHSLLQNSSTELSGGQKARIGLIRTLLANPLALLLDEPFANLDHSLKKDLTEFLNHLIEINSLPTLIATHDLNNLPKYKEIIDLTKFKTR